MQCMQGAPNRVQTELKKFAQGLPCRLQWISHQAPCPVLYHALHHFAGALACPGCDDYWWLLSV